jgi:hypothetical protein
MSLLQASLLILAALGASAGVVLLLARLFARAFGYR